MGWSQEDLKLIRNGKTGEFVKLAIGELNDSEEFNDQYAVQRAQVYSLLAIAIAIEENNRIG